MGCSWLDPRSTRGLVVSTLLCGLVILPAAVLAQSTQHRVMVMDDGAGPSVFHFSGPDTGELRVPDFVRKDLPVFYEKLRLDELQQLVVRVLLDAYLDAFKILVDESMSSFEHPMMPLAFVGDGHEDGAILHGGDDSLQGIIHDALREAGGAGTIDVEAEFGGPVAIQIRAAGGSGDEVEQAGPDGESTEDVAIWAHTGDGEGDMSAPAGGVFIAVEGPEGMDIEIPDEVMEMLEQKAQEMAERIREQLEDAEANGMAFEDDMPSPQEHLKRMEKMRQDIERFERAKESLKQTFISDVRSQLLPRQFERWPAVEMTLTRFKTLPKGRLDGEKTDLLRVVDRLEIDELEQEAVAEPLAAYEVSLHNALVDRNQYLKESAPKIDESMSKGEFDKALIVVDQTTKRRVRVRDINEQATESIAQKLSDETAREFRKLVLETSYPRVYRPTRAQKAFNAVQRIDGLDQDTMVAVETLRETYAAELAAANERLREKIRRYQPKESRQVVERLQGMMEGGDMTFSGHGVDDAVHAAFAKRRDLDERYMKQVYALLAPEQLERLPKLPSQTRRRPMIIQRN